MQDLWTPGELASYLRISLKTTYRLINKGEISGAFKLGGSWFIKTDQFLSSLEDKAKSAQKIKGDAPRGRHSL